MISFYSRLPNIGRSLFIVGLMALGAEHFIFNMFVVGRAPEWPDGLSGQLIWAYATGVFFIGICLLMLMGKKVRLAALSGACLVFVWAFFRHLPVLVPEPLLSGAWTSAGKALVFTGGLLAISGTAPWAKLPPESPLARVINAKFSYVMVARSCLAIFLLITGIQHFLFVEFVASLIPGWFPGNAVFWTYFAGIALISGGLGLFIPQTAPLAALLTGIMIFSWFWIVHLPRVTVSMSDQIAVFEALAFSGLAFFLTLSSATSPEKSGSCY